MDISHVFVFIILNLLPAKIQKCEAFEENSPNPIFMLQLNKQKEWEFRRQDQDVRTFRFKKNQIQEKGQTGWASSYDMDKHLDLKGLNWKTVTTLSLKEPAYLFQIQRKKGECKLTPNVSGALPIIIKY